MCHQEALQYFQAGDMVVMRECPLESATCTAVARKEMDKKSHGCMKRTGPCFSAGSGATRVPPPSTMARSGGRGHQDPLWRLTGARALLFQNTKKCRCLVNCICTHVTGSRAREHETCVHDAAAASIRMPVERVGGPNAAMEKPCLRPDVLTGRKVSPDPTRLKARQFKWNCSEHVKRHQPTNNV